VGILLDDFGTGYSSLTHLMDLPIDGLKLDRSFVGSVASCARSRAIIASMIHLSQGLGLCVVAEGVEEQDQLDFLREAGCDSFQGFLACPPLPPERFPAATRAPIPRTEAA